MVTRLLPCCFAIAPMRSTNASAVAKLPVAPAVQATGHVIANQGPPGSRGKGQRLAMPTLPVRKLMMIADHRRPWTN